MVSTRPITVSTNLAGRGTDIVLGGNAEMLAKLDVMAGASEELKNDPKALAKAIEDTQKEYAAKYAGESEAIKEIECHGVSVIEVTRSNGTWSYVQGSALNRRITPNTPMAFSGPVKGSAWLKIEEGMPPEMQNMVRQQQIKNEVRRGARTGQIVRRALSGPLGAYESRQTPDEERTICTGFEG